MKVPVFIVFDTVADCTLVIGTGNSDKAFIRQNLPYLAKMNPNYLEDYKVFEIGSFTESSFLLESLETPRLVDWNCYSDKRSIGDAQA